MENTNTTTENRDRYNRYLQNMADSAAADLASLQRDLAATMTEGKTLTWSALERLAEAQARADIWARVAQIRDFWARNPARAPEHADLVEAAHEVRTRLINESLSYEGGRNSSAMAEGLERAAQTERREFIQRTARIYPEGSPLEDLGR